MDDNKILTQLTEHNVDIQNIKIALNEMKENQKIIQDFALSLKDMASEMKLLNNRFDVLSKDNKEKFKDTNDKLSIIGDEIEEIKKKPASNWEWMWKLVIGAVILAVLTFSLDFIFNR